MSDALARASSIQEQFFANNYVAVASIAILYYDYLLTLPAEISRFWSMRRITWASSFFYLNRYLTLLGHGPVVHQYFWSSSSPERFSVCLSLLLFHQYLAIAVQTIVGILLIMRTYALYKRNIWVLLGLCAAGGVVIAFGTWCVVSGGKSTQTAASLPITGCLVPISQDDASRLASAWTGMLCFDVLIFGMTIYKSITRKREGRSTLLNVLIRDGAIYFGVMVIAGLSVIITFYVSPEYERGITTTLTNVISSTMISRLMLNLRDPEISSTRPSRRSEDAGFSTAEPVLTTFINTNYESEYFSDWSQNRTRVEPELRGSDIEMILRTKDASHV
ncbi:hypothetical protein BDQ12DRAFT_734091 [Crucibulum laeve]|uniref:DUF6533 domain-containing protein n=1 Tax=Crucibulum laeve TaxID=68775 RepID=A0A5C3M3Q7_9AGAR|nr:hypothetical protein BDQ12DRAFT_734091 [Crucibulum laeve]